MSTSYFVSRIFFLIAEHLYERPTDEFTAIEAISSKWPWKRIDQKRIVLSIVLFPRCEIEVNALCNVVLLQITSFRIFRCYESANNTVICIQISQIYIIAYELMQSISIQLFWMQ